MIQDAGDDELSRRHRALIERDRWVGLEAEVDAAHTHAAYLQEKLDEAQERVDRKNARIKKLTARIKELEAQQPTGLRARISRRR